MLCMSLCRRAANGQGRGRACLLISGEPDRQVEYAIEALASDSLLSGPQLVRSPVQCHAFATPIKARTGLA
jgi:hypothetical protein